MDCDEHSLNFLEQCIFTNSRLMDIFFLLQKKMNKEKRLLHVKASATLNGIFYSKLFKDIQ